MTDSARASLRPLLTWALVIFLAGVLVGLGISRATSALSASPSTVTLSPIVDGGAVRAGRMAEARLYRDGTVRVTGRTPEDPEFGTTSSVEPARTTSHADDTPAGSEEHLASPPTVLTTQVHGLAATPPASVVLIHAAAAEFGVDPRELVDLAMCESSLNVLAIGRAGEVGLLQFKPATFAWFARDSALGYDLRDIGDPRAQARVAAWAIANGYSSHWTCWP